MHSRFEESLAGFVAYCCLQALEEVASHSVDQVYPWVVVVLEKLVGSSVVHLGTGSPYGCSAAVDEPC